MSPSPVLRGGDTGVLSAAELGGLLQAGTLAPGAIVVAELHLTLVSPVPSCPPQTSCVFGPAEWRVDGISPTVLLDATPYAPGLTGASAGGIFALQIAPAKSGGRIDLLGKVTPGPDGLAWTVAQASTGSWSLAVVEGWLGAVNYVWPCPTYSNDDPLTMGYACGHGEWLADTPTQPSPDRLTPAGALRVEAGAYASFVSASGASAPQPAPQRGAYLVVALPHACPAAGPSASDTGIERCNWLRVVGEVAPLPTP